MHHLLPLRPCREPKRDVAYTFKIPLDHLNAGLFAQFSPRCLWNGFACLYLASEAIVLPGTKPDLLEAKQHLRGRLASD